jgi:hypothetical protein
MCASEEKRRPSELSINGYFFPSVYDDCDRRLSLRRAGRKSGQCSFGQSCMLHGPSTINPAPRSPAFLSRKFEAGFGVQGSGASIHRPPFITGTLSLRPELVVKRRSSFGFGSGGKMPPCGGRLRWDDSTLRTSLSCRLSDTHKNTKKEFITIAPRATAIRQHKILRLKRTPSRGPNRPIACATNRATIPQNKCMAYLGAGATINHATNAVPIGASINQGTLDFFADACRPCLISAT